MGRLSRWLQRITRTESLIAFGEYLWWALRHGLPALVGAMSGWLLSSAEWFWASLGIGGVLVAAVLVWFLIVLGIYVRGHWRQDKEAWATASASGATPGSEPELAPAAPIEGEDETYDGAHEQLMLFVADHLIPCCDTLFCIQTVAIGKLCTIQAISDLAIKGAPHNSRLNMFMQGYDRLIGLEDSPPKYIPLDQMTKGVDIVEKYYKDLVGETLSLIRNNGLVTHEHESLTLYAFQWAKEHEAMVAAYEPIRKNSKLGRLFRPSRPSRWNDGLGQAVSFMKDSVERFAANHGYRPDGLQSPQGTGA